MDYELLKEKYKMKIFVETYRAKIEMSASQFTANAAATQAVNDFELEFSEV